jgi:hypothetical protein
MAALAALVVIPTSSAQTATAAKSHKFRCKLQGTAPKNQPTNLKANVNCTVFGKGKQTGKLVLPKSIGTWKFKGGSFHIVAVGTIKGPNASGTFKLSKGTGKYKGWSGKGTFSGSLATQKFTYKGTAKS